MQYVFDSGPFIDMRTYYPETFPSFWENISDCASNGIIISTREVRNELNRRVHEDYLEEWVKENGHIFKTPSIQETNFVREIFRIEHYQQSVKKNHILLGFPVADPWVIALAKCNDATVVTSESFKKNSASIPTICHRFDIPCTSLLGFMKALNWKY